MSYASTEEQTTDIDLFAASENAAGKLHCICCLTKFSIDYSEKNLKVHTLWKLITFLVVVVSIHTL